MKQMLRLGFSVMGYPGSGRRIELESDLATVSGSDLIQGAFMGDAVVELGETDFSTRFGWVTLLDWCLRVTSAVRALADAPAHHFTFSESDDFMSFRRHGPELYVACSYRPGIAVVPYADLIGAVEAFVGERLRWISENYPRAMENPAMGEVLAGVQWGPPDADG